MSQLFDQSFIDRVRESVNIVDVIGSYIPIKRAGNTYKARCPFHDEKTPSFNINEGRQIFKCFGCGKAGTAITFVRDYEHIGFREAVEKLAARAGIPLPDRGLAHRDETDADRIARMYGIASEFYRESLATLGEKAREYLRERRISDETVAKFELGYAPDSFNGLLQRIQRENWPKQLLEASGLFKVGESGGFYDSFRDRVMFPIRSVTGRVVAFGGRILESGKHPAKYINSPTTVLYTKGRELYGLYETRYEIAKRNMGIVVEGNTDLLRMYAEGFHNTVATLGTSITAEQITLLGRFTPNATVLYDGDKAGRTAALRAGVMLLKEGMTARIALLPEGEDPDSYLITHGPEAMQFILDLAKSVIRFLHDDMSAEQTDRQKLETVVEIVAAQKDDLSRELIAKEANEVFGVMVSTILNTAGKKGVTSVEKQSYVNRNEYPVEREVIRHILQNPETAKIICEFIVPDYFVSKDYKKLCAFITEKADELTRLPALIEEMPEGEQRNLLVEMLLEESPAGSTEEIIKKISVYQLENELKSIDSLLRSDPENASLFTRKQKVVGQLRLFHGKRVRRILE